MPEDGTDLRPALGTRVLGVRLVQYEALDSTNLEALRLAEAGAEAGTVVTAQTQIRGRGRLGRRWLDLPGRCLLMTVLVEPPDEHPGRLTAAAALAVAEAIETLGGAPQLKWPNDVLVGGRKLAGVLGEGSRAGLMAVGIGVNVNGSPEDLPRELQQRATFLSHELARPLDRDALRDEILQRLDESYDALKRGEGRAMMQRITPYDCLRGRRVELLVDGVRLRGEATGWRRDGSMEIRDAEGHSHVVRGGEVTLL
ncbi:MAG: biotin--[acetyl-CoA-carboxylase] ligase [Armatimonadota bacterium]|nr:biotin--[acetyl-CoA-carboxylase] ligase [Armatimonadota bacterium]